MSFEAPLVSVITPFYNTDRYLAACIESVLRQSYENWEYILVDNCSTDDSTLIAEKYVQLHPGKLRLERNSRFLSQIENYNQSLRFTSPDSKYCKLVQADDLLFPQCLELMIEVAERDSSVGVVGSYSLEGSDLAFDGLPFPSPITSGGAVCRLFFLNNRYVFGSVTQLLLRSEVVRNRTPFYDAAFEPFEDAAAIFEVLALWKFGFVHQVLTFSRREHASLMMRLLDMDSPLAFRLFMLRSFGRKFLDDAEYRQRLKWAERAYAQLIIDGVMALRGNSFLEFHGLMLKRMGYTASSGRLWWCAVLGVLDVLLNPKRGLRLFSDGLRRRRALRGNSVAGQANEPGSVTK